MRHLILAAIAVLLVSACDLLGPAIPPTQGGLGGREFWSTSVEGHDLVPDTRVTLRFGADGTLGGSAGCNIMSGTWALDGTTLVAAINAITEMGCDEPRMAQDEWVGAFLSSGLSAAIDADELVLTGAGVTMTLLDREVADPDQPLEGTTWVLDGVQTGAGDESAVSSVPAGLRSTMRLDAGQLAVDTGCNTGTASVGLEGDTLTIGPLALTKRGCAPDATELERIVTAVLQGAVQVEIDGRMLTVTGAGAGLMFRAE
jgi:heat shock protein HslJ